MLWHILFFLVSFCYILQAPDDIRFELFADGTNHMEIMCDLLMIGSEPLLGHLSKYVRRGMTVS
jgi:hypothetical protein